MMCYVHGFLYPLRVSLFHRSPSSLSTSPQPPTRPICLARRRQTLPQPFPREQPQSQDHQQQQQQQSSSSQSISSLSSTISNKLPSSKQPPDRETLLLAELQAPFRGPRMFISSSLTTSAFIALMITLGRAVSGAGDFVNEILVNILVNAVGILLFGWLFISDLRRRERDLERIGGRVRVGELMVELSGGKVTMLKKVVGKKRIVVVSGNAEKVRDAVRGKGGEKDELVVIVGGDGKRLGVGGRAGKGVAKIRLECEKNWLKWLDEERFDVGAATRRKEVLVTVVEKNGKVNRLPKGKTDWTHV